MLKKSNNLQIYKEGLYFLSLGGIGEIGANCYLYCCDGKWIMIDLGLSFADEKFPGIDLLVPKINFLEDIKTKLEAIIISHGHEDHAGAVAYLADNLIQLVNIIGSIFYGNVLGIFLIAFFLKVLKSNAVFIGAIITQIIIIIAWFYDWMPFLWLNVFGCVMVILISFLIHLTLKGFKAS